VADKEGDDDATARSVLVISTSAWCHELAKWMKEEREGDSGDDSNEQGGPPVLVGCCVRPWLPCSLETLFTGESK